MITTKNETENNIFIKVNIRDYPNDERIVEIFRNKILLSNFAYLGSGTESVIKNLFLMLKPENIAYVEPTWGMLDAFVKQFNLKQYIYEYTYEDREFDFDYDLIKNKDIVYLTYSQNNFFRHRKLTDTEIYKLSNNNRYIILDLTYLPMEYGLLHKFPKNVIVVGNYSKFFGANARFAYINFYDNNLFNKYHEYRERHINGIVAELIMNFDKYKKQLKYKYYNLLENRMFNYKYFVQLTKHYIIFNTNNSNIPNIENRLFMVGDNNFIRIGIPNNRKDYNRLINKLKEVNYL